MDRAGVEASLSVAFEHAMAYLSSLPARRRRYRRHDDGRINNALVLYEPQAYRVGPWRYQRRCRCVIVNWHLVACRRERDTFLRPAPDAAGSRTGAGRVRLVPLRRRARLPPLDGGDSVDPRSVASLAMGNRLGASRLAPDRACRTSLGRPIVPVPFDAGRVQAISRRGQAHRPARRAERAW
jgi:hypothetical protein